MGQPEDVTADPPVPAADVTASVPNPSTPTETHAFAVEPVASPRPDVPWVPGYEMLGELGRGGLGVVYKARRMSLNRVEAVKFILGNASSGHLIRFRREAEAVARLQHPNIIQIFEVSECPTGAYLALEFVDGGTLKEKVAGVPQPPREAARVVETLARAIHHAHEMKIVHRDLKPANVLMTSGGVLKVADFGLARALDSDAGITRTTDFVGTPAYAAPEQVLRKAAGIGPATDVHALGVILYELLTGRVPFEADTLPGLLRMVAEAEPESPRRLVRGVPRDLETICLKCLQKAPGKRYASAAALADDLRRFQLGEPIAARPIGPYERLDRWARRNPVMSALLGSIIMLLAVLAFSGTIFSLRLQRALSDSEADRRRAVGLAETAQAASGREKEAKRAAEQERDAARRAEREGKEKLLQSLQFEARYWQSGRRVGQRFNTLDAIRRATALARELGMPEETFGELRNLAASTLALPDIRAASAWADSPTDMGNTWGVPLADPTFRFVAVPHQRGVVSIRRVGTGPEDCGEWARLPGFGREVAVLWSGDGRHLGVRHWGRDFYRLQVWRLDGGKPVLVHEEARNCLGFDFTGDGSQLFTVVAPDGLSGRRVGLVHDLAGGRELHSFPLPPATGRQLAVHPTRPEVAVALPTHVAMIGFASGTELGRVPLPGQVDVVWHPHGDLLAACFLEHVEIWDAPRGRRNWRIEQPGGGNQAAFNRTGDLLAVGNWGGRVRLWNPYTGREILGTNGGPPRFGPGYHLDLRFPASATQPAGPLSVVEPGRECRRFALGTGVTSVNGLTSCAVHPGGRLAATVCAQGFSLIDLRTGSEAAFLNGVLCRAVLFEPDGSLLVRSALGLHRWPVRPDPADPTRLTVGPPERVPVTATSETVSASTDGTVLAAGAGLQGAALWRRDRPRDERLLPHTDCRHVAVSPDGRLVATGSWSGRGIKVWDAGTGRLLRTLLPENAQTMPRFSPDGGRLVNAYGPQWSTADWSEGPPPPPGTYLGGFSPDGRVEVWCGQGFVVLRDPRTHRELVRLDDPYNERLNFVAFSPDGTLMVAGTNDSQSGRVWDLRRIRAGLAELGLDWDAAPYPPAPPDDPGAGPLRVDIVGETLLTNPALMAAHRREHVLLTLWADPLDPDARLELGEQLLRARKPAEALAQLAAAVALRPDQVSGRYLRLLARFQVGDMEGVVADADALERLRPGYELTTAYRAQALTRLGRNPDTTAPPPREK